MQVHILIRHAGRRIEHRQTCAAPDHRPAPAAACRQSSRSSRASAPEQANRNLEILDVNILIRFSLLSISSRASSACGFSPITVNVSSASIGVISRRMPIPVERLLAQRMKCVMSPRIFLVSLPGVQRLTATRSAIWAFSESLIGFAGQSPVPHSHLCSEHRPAQVQPAQMRHSIKEQPANRTGDAHCHPRNTPKTSYELKPQIEVSMNTKADPSLRLPQLRSGPSCSAQDDTAKRGSLASARRTTRRARFTGTKTSSHKQGHPEPVRSRRGCS